MLAEPATLYVVSNEGQVSANGKMLTMGNFFGEDFILEDPSLRRNVKAVALTYVEAIVTEREETMELLQREVGSHNSVCTVHFRIPFRVFVVSIILSHNAHPTTQPATHPRTHSLTHSPTHPPWATPFYPALL